MNQLITLALLIYFNQQLSISKKWSPETYCFGNRYYEPKLGRFTQADTLIPSIKSNGLNRYTGFYNNPLKYNDPDGHTPHDPSEDYSDVIPYKRSVPGTLPGLHPTAEVLGHFNPSLPLISSKIALARTKDESVKHLISEMQKVIGDQGTLLGIPVVGTKLSLEHKGKVIASYDHYLLYMQTTDNPRPDSHSYKAAKELENLFALSNDLAFENNYGMHIFAADTQTYPFLRQYGGGRTYMRGTKGSDQSLSSIFLDTSSQYEAPVHQGPPFQFPLGVTAFHEIFSHAGECFKRKDIINIHNTLIEDLQGKYDEAHQIDNNLIIPAYNENNPQSPIPQRAHYREPRTPKFRKFLFYDIFFERSKPKEKKGE